MVMIACNESCTPSFNACAGSASRGRDGGVCEELAGGVAPMTIHHEEPARPPGPLVWTVVFTILLVAAVAIFALVLISLVASRITTGRAKRLPARFLRRRGRARDFIPLINVQSGGPLWGEPLTFWTLSGHCARSPFPRLALRYHAILTPPLPA